MNRLIHPGRRAAGFALHRMNHAKLFRSNISFFLHRCDVPSSKSIPSVFARSFSSDKGPDGEKDTTQDSHDKKEDQQQEPTDTAEENSPENPDESPEDTIARLQQELQTMTNALTDAKQEATESKETSLRYLADMENVRARCRKDLENQTKFAVQKFAKNLLDTADTLSMAIAAAKAPPKEGTSVETSLQNFIEGIEMTEKGLHKAFEGVGVKRFDSLGEKFDPTVHDGLFELPDPNRETGTVGAVLKEGYMINDRVLRAANVGTVRNPE